MFGRGAPALAARRSGGPGVVARSKNSRELLLALPA
jgi:hypothetical protein